MTSLHQKAIEKPIIRFVKNRGKSERLRVVIYLQVSGMIEAWEFVFK